MKVLQYPHECLLQPCEQIDTQSRDVARSMRALCVSMIQTMHDRKGWGLAAPQVGVNIRLFVVHVPHEMMGPMVFVNPNIESVSTESIWLREGCLSFKDIYDSIQRPSEVLVSRFNENGIHERRQFKGWLARVIQHETDHLNGTVFTEHMTPVGRKQVEKIFRKRHVATTPA